MKIKWYGHAAFLVTATDGTSGILDPYTPELAGHQPITDEPTFVITSSATDDAHCRSDLILGDPIRINALDIAEASGTQTVAGVEIKAIKAMEALTHRDNNPDQNAMYRFEMDGVSVGHMGDVGNPLTQSQMDFFKGVDVLLALTGGYPTILLDDLKTAIDYIHPKYVVPMHFRTLRIKFTNFLWIESFLKYFDEEKEVDFVHDYQVSLTPDDLPSSTRVLVMSYSN